MEAEAAAREAEQADSSVVVLWKTGDKGDQKWLKDVKRYAVMWSYLVSFSDSDGFRVSS
jgi:hypothetical protein